MKDIRSGAYFINRRPSRRSARKNRRAAGVLIAVLLLLSAGICLLIVFMPKLTGTVASSSPEFGGKTFYFMATAESTDRAQATVLAGDTAARGGAGYIYNDGKYHVVAAVYEREADVKTLVSINADSHYFALTVPAVKCGDGDKALLEYITGDWFTTLYTAATELDRGNVSDAAAEFTVVSALDRLAELARGASGQTANAANAVAQLRIPDNRSVLSYVRYLQASALVCVRAALTGSIPRA